jgi:hypothetical protein
MNWFKKAFMPKVDDNSSDAMTPQQLGDCLFNLCIRQVSSFLDGLEHSQKINEVKVDREDINQVELLIAFMWLYFDLLQVKKYEKTFTRMHTCFMDHMTKLNLEEAEIWQTLQMRYDDYRQSAIDSTFKRVASEICKNILDLDMPNTNLMLEVQMTITLQQNILMIEKTIKSNSLKG